MFRITQDPSSGSDSLYLIEITNDGSYVLIMCAIGVWRHVLDLWRVCALHRAENYCSSSTVDSSSQPDAVHTQATGPEHAAKHRSRT